MVFLSATAHVAFAQTSNDVSTAPSSQESSATLPLDNLKTAEESEPVEKRQTPKLQIEVNPTKSETKKQNSERSKSVSFGHNVAQTSNVFPAGDCTIGTYLFACGITDKLTMGMSPWLYVSYNADNVMLRYQIYNKPKETQTVQLAYIKTYKPFKKMPSQTDSSSPSYDPDYCVASRKCFIGYEMDTLWSYFIHTVRYTKSYNLHLNAQLAYYWNDTKPFSIRRPQAVRTEWQSNISVLNEVQLYKSFYLNGEFGILGISEKYPALHSGVTIDYRGINWSVRLGGSGTGNLAGWWGVDRFDYHSYALYASEEGLDRKFADSELQKDFSVHPEIYVQYSFSL